MCEQTCSSNPQAPRGDLLCSGPKGQKDQGNLVGGGWFGSGVCAAVPIRLNNKGRCSGVVSIACSGNSERLSTKYDVLGQGREVG